MIEIYQNMDAWELFIVGWLFLGLFYVLLWVAVLTFDALKERKHRLTPRYAPFTAGRLKNPDGSDRGDAFGVKIPAHEQPPKAGKKIYVNTGHDFELFTVKMCETLTVLGSQKPGTHQDFSRADEVYILVNEKLSDKTILRVKEAFGNQGFDPKRNPIGEYFGGRVEPIQKK